MPCEQRIKVPAHIFDVANGFYHFSQGLQRSLYRSDYIEDKLTPYKGRVIQFITEYPCKVFGILDGKEELSKVLVPFIYTLDSTAWPISITILSGVDVPAATHGFNIINSANISVAHDVYLQLSNNVKLLIGCGSGQYFSEEGACISCAPGTFANVAGSTSCAPCEPGTFTANIGSAECSPCNAGTVTPSSGSISCIPCPPLYVSTTNHTVCDLCPLETAPNSDQSECVPVTPVYKFGAPVIFCSADTKISSVGQYTLAVLLAAENIERDTAVCRLSLDITDFPDISQAPLFHHLATSTMPIINLKNDCIRVSVANFVNSPFDTGAGLGTNTNNINATLFQFSINGISTPDTTDITCTSFNNDPGNYNLVNIDNAVLYLSEHNPGLPSGVTHYLIAEGAGTFVPLYLSEGVMQTCPPGAGSCLVVPDVVCSAAVLPSNCLQMTIIGESNSTVTGFFFAATMPPESFASIMP